MARLYADENFPLPVAGALRLAGHDVVTAQETGDAGRRDEEILQAAIRDARAVLTLDRRDFIRPHRERSGQHEGVVVCTFDVDFDGLAGRIHASVVEAGVLKGKSLRVKRDGAGGTGRS